MTESDKHRLLSRLCEGELDPAEVALLTRACRENPGLLTEAARFIETERLLTHHFAPQEDPELFIRELLERLAEPEEPASSIAPYVVQQLGRAEFRRKVRIAVSSGLAMAAALVLGFFLWFETPVATVTSLVSPRWPAGAAQLREGDRLSPGRVALSAGFMEIRFAQGAEAIVEGPAEFEIMGGNRLRLISGQLFANVPEGARGFTVENPQGRLVDLGTRFGVSVAKSGETELHVVEGLVEAHSGHTVTPVRSNGALRIDTQGKTPIDLDAALFLTGLPPKSTPGVSPSHIHWSFDEGSGSLVHNTGRGLAGAEEPGVLVSEGGAGDGPSWIEGKKGSALAFDGLDDLVRTSFQGIAGNDPRTVTFWVKVPVDWSPEHGYAIIGWGQNDHREPGAAWQIAVNPDEADGPLGRLRVGTSGGTVIGTTPLMDGEWHHVAVVMYGGPDADTSTHVLLYIDGELEPAARKSIARIRTRTHGRGTVDLQMGRNIAYRPGVAPPRTRFFRGSLDEVQIFDHALPTTAIRQLMDLP